MKNTNEITVKLNCSLNEFEEYMRKEGFRLKEKFTLDDTFFIPQTIDTKQKKVREILASASLVREVKWLGREKHIKALVYKIKEFDENDNIVNQKTIYCDVDSIEKAKDFIEAIGYKEIMHISEKDYIYENESFELALKDIKDGNLLMKIEENEEFNTIDKIKAKLNEFDLPINKDNYFVKKAEIELEKIIKNTL